ncbi:hypothetical protein B0H67DRAFT_550773 [Lasiosphaeris hirsuta]|uniref:Secreted protein n=1 Tax=Lasiosphaeris hirsuta TaxID=260670 RepID=A0AA40E5X9_9PEZI|nr:hypothetical protein B0H67DRAFT_550773 [Lasiosphaeris hirsuta]
MVQSSALMAFAAALLPALVSAQTNETLYPIPIAIGTIMYPHGHIILAWEPTKTTFKGACSPGVDNPTRTYLQTVNTNIYSKPLCNQPFDIDGYKNLELLCADADDGNYHASQVTAIATDGKKTHDCVKLPRNLYPVACDDTHITSIEQNFACQ